ncbi:rhomboid family intramembrane serine protease [Periweissella fabalis]|uniref:Rhomboid family intramembrane serine protease n=1 Tax=Periweissella fabalis TaxID=1070421 RepID=A0A7X6N5Y6_9LACO|nr:rhomboid family intramembrane serine protease [Periweissella fabalis]MCM0598806.1 rhomboid family intramembrane serine protease [Periweissella fabalis]NKZ24595.1 rhomboid family intramembrane serine protease [Periweissella fabalis]
MQIINKKPYITYLLVAISIIVFIIMTVSGGTTAIPNLLRFGASFQPYILAGQWYRLITPIFIHIGFEHLFLNMLTVYFCGIFLEQLFGWWRFTLIYMIAGIGGNLLSSSLMPNTISAGASTSIFGMFGAFVMLGFIYRQSDYFHALGRQFGILIIMNLVFALWPGSGIDILGHVGGLITGFLTALMVGTPKNFGPNIRRYQFWGMIGLAIYTIVTMWWLYNG